MRSLISVFPVYSIPSLWKEELKSAVTGERRLQVCFVAGAGTSVLSKARYVGSFSWADGVGNSETSWPVGCSCATGRIATE